MYLGRTLETGTRQQVFGAPRHPSTRALLSGAVVPDPARLAAASDGGLSR